jgi:hypothetical protein
VSSNTAGRDGGGLWTQTGVTTIERSTINNNMAGGNGGGVAAFGVANITNSILGQNVATINGGAFWSIGGSSLQSSTIYQNRAGQAGGGVFVTAGNTTINSSIIAFDLGPSGTDLSGLLGATLNVHFSLIGNNQGSGFAPAPVGSPDTNGNLIGGPGSATIDPGLAGLALNGGPTQTYAPGANSPVVNAGDPTLVAGVNGVPINDQRGAPFTRVYGGRIDIGAIERQPNPLPADFNYNGVVDMADYVLWRAPRTISELRADANGDGRVDDADLAVWRANFGNTYASGTASVAAAPKSALVAPSKMLPDTALVDRPVDSTSTTVGLRWPVPQSSGSRAKAWSTISPAGVAPSSSQLGTLAAADSESERQTFLPLRSRQRHIVDWLPDSLDGEVSALDEAFATLGERNTLAQRL